jgi:hypothetical protein
MRLSGRLSLGPMFDLANEKSCEDRSGLLLWGMVQCALKWNGTGAACVLDENEADSVFRKSHFQLNWGLPNFAQQPTGASQRGHGSQQRVVIFLRCLMLPHACWA